MTLLLLIACAEDAPTAEAGPEELARNELMPGCKSFSHDGGAFADCVVKSIAAATTYDEAQTVCASLQIRQDECRKEWALRMMNRAEPEQLRTMCGTDAECLEELEKSIAWRKEMEAEPQ